MVVAGQLNLETSYAELGFLNEAQGVLLGLC